MYGPPPGPPAQPRRTGLKIGLIVGGVLVALLAFFWVVGTIAGPPPEKPAKETPAAAPATPTPTPSATLTPRPSKSAPAPVRQAPPAPTARQLTDRLEQLYPLPNQRDNTHSCKAAGCRQLITTDTVSVYDWGSAATAKRWASGGRADVIGQYVLSYAGTEQQMTSDEARADMAAEVKRMTAAP